MSQLSIVSTQYQEGATVCENWGLYLNSCLIVDIYLTKTFYKCLHFLKEVFIQLGYFNDWGSLIGNSHYFDFQYQIGLKTHK